MLFLPLKSRIQISYDKKNAEFACKSNYVIVIVSPTFQKNIGPNKIFRATDFLRFVMIVSKRINKRAVVRNKFRRRIKEAFKLVDKNLLKNHYDYQIIARQLIYKASIETIKNDIEKCLRKEGEIIDLNDNHSFKKKKRKNIFVNMKTKDILTQKLQ